MPTRAKAKGTVSDDLRWRLDRSGSFVLRGPDHCPRRLPGRKARAIVGYLAFHVGQHVTRDRLIGLLWSDRSEAHARGSLRQCLLEIRQVAPGLISSDHEHEWIESDRIAIDWRCNTSRSSRLFEDLDGVSTKFDQWLRRQRKEEADREWVNLERDVEDILSRAKCGKALPMIERMHRIDPYSEDWVRLAMRAERQLGHPAGVVRSFTEFAECLRNDLGVLPALETRALRDRLLNELTVKTEAALFGARSMDLADPILRARLCGMG